MNAAALWVPVGLVVVLLGGLAVSYNRFVAQRNHIRESWANVDTELRRRYDLIPNLVSTVKGYAAHERAVFESVTAARAAAAGAGDDASARAPAEGALVRSVRDLLAVAEGYPELRASENFLELQRELAITEDRIQAARRFYNANVRDYNRRVAAVPSNIVASWFKFRVAAFFEVEEAIRAAGAPRAG